MKHYYWILDENGNPLKVNDPLTWAAWYETAERHIGNDFLPGGIQISTVFLGLDHSFSFLEESPPVLWETMIFGGEEDGYQERYCTKEEALEGHKIAVMLAQMSLSSKEVGGSNDNT
jgi:hypothetical protein